MGTCYMYDTVLSKTEQTCDWITCRTIYLNVLAKICRQVYAFKCNFACVLTLCGQYLSMSRHEYTLCVCVCLCVYLGAREKGRERKRGSEKESERECERECVCVVCVFVAYM